MMIIKIKAVDMGIFKPSRDVEGTILASFMNYERITPEELAFQGLPVEFARTVCPAHVLKTYIIAPDIFGFRQEVLLKCRVLGIVPVMVDIVKGDKIETCYWSDK